MITHFDLGFPIRRATRVADVFSGESAGVSLPEEPAIDALLSHIHFRFDPAWAHYYRSAALSRSQRSALLRAALQSTVFDSPMLFALFLLMSAKDGAERHVVNLERLNRARRLSGKAELLEHVEVRMNLQTQRSDSRSDLNARNGIGRRLHHVRGHLARRGCKIFWRAPHLRGNARLGILRSRTVELTFR
jgi:hypothetical protein